MDFQLELLRMCFATFAHPKSVGPLDPVQLTRLASGGQK